MKTTPYLCLALLLCIACSHEQATWAGSGSDPLVSLRFTSTDTTLALGDTTTLLTLHGTLLGGTRDTAWVDILWGSSAQPNVHYLATTRQLPAGVLQMALPVVEGHSHSTTLQLIPQRVEHPVSLVLTSLNLMRGTDIGCDTLTITLMPKQWADEE